MSGALTAGSWDLVATAYTAEVMPVFERYARRALELAAAPEGADLVDVACGPGTLAIMAALTANRVAAIDYAPEMIDRLRAHQGYGVLGNIDARVGDGQELPYGDAEFDAGFSLFGLMFFPDRARGFRELRRVVKPGGKVVVSSWLPLDAAPLLFEVVAALRHAMPELPAAPRGGPLADEASIREEVLAAGYRDVDVHQVSFAAEYPSTAELWASQERSAVRIALTRTQLGPAAWAPIAERTLARLEAVVGSGPQSMAMPAWLAVATV
ncbi:MAG TPA: class I SAM-dependent methyltransferase [Kofleriaceae bacterium]|nr:class I SAM-dependent methyltransferase [Kofleriaceae bacterium]